MVFSAHSLILETKRVILRQWKESDLQPFAELTADPAVMRYFPSVLNREESDTLAGRFRAAIAANGWGYWAVELRETGEFAGFVGLAYSPSRYAFSPCTEISWRLGRRFWHRGIACEAAQAALNYGFKTLSLDEIVSFTSVHNAPSERLMQRLGMHKQGQFMHPALPADHFLAEHVVYNITREQMRRGA